MEDAFIVIMIKDEETGFLERELTSFKIEENEKFIVNIYAKENEKTQIYVKLSTDKEVDDWEFEAIYDYYDEALLKDKTVSIKEAEECYNPTWEIVIDYHGDDLETENLLKSILEIHKNELLEVYDVIKDKKNEYEGD